MARRSKSLRKERNWIFAVLLLHACLEWVFIPRADAQAITPEYQLKASYLGKIPNFVQWPKTEGAKAESTPEVIRLCVVGNYAFGALLAQEAGRATVAGRKMEVRWMHKELELKGCQIIFVSRSEERRYGKILESAKGTNALTVGETDGFLQAGGIVELNFENDTLKFEVNLTAARAANLKLDSRLLAMAKRVIREKEQTGT